jgi:acid phosphatase (class A)
MLRWLLCTALTLTTATTLGAQASPPPLVQAGAIDAAKVLPPPPAEDSLAGSADLEAVRQAQAWRTPDQVAWARSVEKDDPFAAATVLGPWFRAENLPLCADLLQRVGRDTKAVSDRAKDLFPRRRPPLVDPRILPCVLLPASSSYPSGHATRAFIRALVLGEVLPDRRQALLDEAHRSAWGRILGGVHFPTDDVGGRLLAEAIFAELKRSPAFQTAVAACRAEVQTKGMKKAG